MTNPWDHLTEKEAQERRLAQLHWQIQQERNDRTMLLFADHDVEACIRRRAKRRMAKYSVYAALVIGGIWAVWRWMYLNYLWQ